MGVFKARECPEGPEKLGESGKIWEIDACDFTDETDMSLILISCFPCLYIQMIGSLFVLYDILLV